MNVWGYKKKAKIFLELERYWQTQQRAGGAYAKKKLSQFQGAKEYCLKKIKLLKK